MAVLEMIEPTQEVSSAIAISFDGSLMHIATTLKSTNDMLAAIPGDAEYQVVVGMRLKAGIANVEAFQKSVLDLADALKSATYPKAAACIAAMSALQDLLAQAKLNAQSHQTEGL